MKLTIDVEVDVETVRDIFIDDVLTDRLCGGFNSKNSIAMIKTLVALSGEEVCEKLFKTMFPPWKVAWSIREGGDTSGDAGAGD